MISLTCRVTYILTDRVFKMVTMRNNNGYLVSIETVVWVVCVGYFPFRSVVLLIIIKFANEMNRRHFECY